MFGIDISADQAAVAPGPWLFVVHKATEGHDYQDPAFVSRFPSLPPLRGAYHYARPGDGFTGAQQADYFASVVLPAGFKPGVDLWQLDCEQQGNDGVSANDWAAFIGAFCLQATRRLGNRGFLYAGWPWLVETLGDAEAHQLVAIHNWWLPDYGVNDGAIHPVSAPFDVQADIVVHQFSSFGALDRNVVYNAAKWDAIVRPVNWPAVAAIVALLKVVTKRPLHVGDRGPNVDRLNALLVRHGYAVAGDAYGPDTECAVADFKLRARLKNRDGKVVGRTCLLALFK